MGAADIEAGGAVEVASDAASRDAAAAPDWLREAARIGWTAALPRRVEGFAGVGGTVKETPEDFVVEERLGWEPSGDGEHVYLLLRRSGRTTPQLAQQVGRAFGVQGLEVGFAGMKDKHAVATQWFSVLHRGDPQAGLDVLQQSGEVEVLASTRHRKRLKTGQLWGNRFRLRVRDLTRPDAQGLAEAVEVLRAQGFPNYFGAQRFGHGGANVADGLALLRDTRRRQGREKRFLVSAVQSAVFNVFVGLRHSEPGWDVVQVGDVLQKTETGGMFVCDDAAVDQARQAAGELVVTGPIPGPSGRQASGVTLALEHRAALLVGTRVFGMEDGQSPELPHLGAAGKLAQGARRAIMVRPRGLEYDVGAAGLELAFELPSGSYATVLVRELTGSL